MKNLLTRNALLIALLFFSCSQKHEIVEATHSNGSPKVVGFYKRAVKISEIKYYENGQKELEGFYNENMQRTGKWIYWFLNGKTWSECEYKNGLKHGKSSVYFENGQLRWEGNYTNDSSSGTWIFRNEKGDLIKEVRY